MKTLLKKGREVKGLTTRQVSELLDIDQALVSKFENGLRNPTKKQLLALASLFEIDPDELLLAWLKEKILREVANEPLALKAVKAAEKELTGNSAAAVMPDQFQKLLNEMESLKAMLGNKG
jgi:transcriptional regulator with XRE-family HTH domain